jgi:hypothetical protein
MFGCRAVLILTALLILLMPLTEHLYAWDRFLQGGPDVEFGILFLLLFAGLVLVMAYRAVSSPLLILLAHRLIALPLRCLRTPGLNAFLIRAHRRQEALLAVSHPATPLRI